jgi:hypothetical protein
VFVPGYDRATGAPHDLVHFVVEHELGLSDGIWGSIASGVVFPNMRVVAGRLGPHPAERSKAVVKAHGQALGVAELLGGFFAYAVGEGAGETPERLLARLKRHLEGLPSPTLSAGHIIQIRAALHAAEIRWRRVPVGGELVMDWLMRPTRVRLETRQPKAGAWRQRR